MAIASPTKVLDLANDVVLACNALKVAFALAKQVSDNNSVNDPGWNTLQATPDADVMDVKTKILTGLRVTPGEVSAAIGSLNVFIDYWTGNSVTTSAWGQNVEKVSPALINPNLHNFKDNV